MEFKWKDEQLALYWNIVNFARRELDEDVVQQDRDGKFSVDLWNRCVEIGLLGLPLPEKYEGTGIEPVTCALVMEGLGYGCLNNGLLLSLGAHLWGVEIPIWKFGSREMKERFLPKLCSGQWIGAHPITGFDSKFKGTIAKREGRYYILNGKENFILNSTVANLILIFVPVDDESERRGKTAFLIESHTPGLTIGSNLDKMGMRTSPLSDIIFEDCKIPVSHRLGEERQGDDISGLTMTWIQSLILAPFLGTMQRQIEKCVEYANQRKQFGKSISSYQSISDKIVEMKIRLEACKLLSYQAASMLQSKDARMLSSLAKLQVSESMVKTFMDAIQIFGGYGYTTEFQVERNLRDAVGTILYSGASRWQRLLIAKKLGLDIEI